MKNIHLLVALASEIPVSHTKTPISWGNDARLITHITGIGKLNAALKAMQVIHEYGRENIHLMLNFGTAGAVKDGLSGLIKISRLCQRDMDIRPLNFPLGQSSFDMDDRYITIDAGGAITLGSGDNFVTSPPEMQCDLVDMEGYAIAKICQEYAVRFDCWKYVSDKADDKAANDWQDNVHKGAHLFYREVLADNIP